ncbi:MAG: hypothetical protein QF879_12040, partial [Candidatus Latescibacteria bacterium]|nr:hypothetical protein [Candidatus Latescibacterota bacterium]
CRYCFWPDDAHQALASGPGKKEREQVMYELAQAYAGRQRAAGDSMMAYFNRQQAEQSTA